MNEASTNQPKPPKRWQKFLRSFYYTIFLPVIIAILLRMFFIDIYRIPSSSMEPTLVPGDLIIVSKIGIGARLRVNDENGKETRMPGISGIKRNDVVVFNFPEGDTIYRDRPELNFYDYAGWQSHAKAIHDTIQHGGLIYLPVNYRQAFVKRCLGLPGDTVRFYKSAVIVNNECAKDPAGSWWHLSDSLKQNPLSYIKNLKNPRTKDFRVYHWFFPHRMDEWWDNDYYGPLYIPKKGGTVKLQLKNISHYWRIITAYEHNTLDTIAGEIRINGTPALSYTFKQNYYFMIGDNHWDSVDSRFWGFVPENHIIGKAAMVLLSSGPSKEGENEFRWKRIFKRVK